MPRSGGEVRHAQLIGESQRCQWSQIRERNRQCQHDDTSALAGAVTGAARAFILPMFCGLGWRRCIVMMAMRRH
jgi:hypothetical protein